MIRSQLSRLMGEKRVRIIDVAQTYYSRRPTPPSAKPTLELPPVAGKLDVPFFYQGCVLLAPADRCDR